MGATLDDLAVVQHHDAVGVADGGQAVGDDEDGSSLHQRIHTGLHLGLGVGIDGGGGLVQNHYRGIGHGGPGNGNQLPLALGEAGTVSGEHGVVAVGQPGDEVVGVGQLGGVDAGLVGGIQLAIADIVHHRAGEQIGFLEHHAQRAAQVGLADFVDVDIVVANLAVVNVVKPVNQIGDGGFSGAGGPYEGYLLARAGIQGDIMQHRILRHIAEVHMLHDNVALQLPVGGGAIGLVEMLPGPVAGALRGLTDVPLAINFSIDQMDIALVLLRLLVHQGEDSLSTGQGHDNGVDLVGNLGDGHVEAPGQYHKCHQIAQGEHLPLGKYHHHATGNGQNGVLDVAQVIVDGAHDVGEFTGGIGVGAELFIQHIEFLLAGVLVVEDFYYPLAVNHFLNIAIHRTQGLLLTDEVFSGLASQIFGGEDNQGDGKQHDNEQQPTGINEVPGNHHQGNQRGGALGNGLAYHLAQGIHVAGVAGHNVAGGVGIEIAQGQALHLYEHLVPDGLLGALADAHHQIVI